MRVWASAPLPWTWSSSPGSSLSLVTSATTSPPSSEELCQSADVSVVEAGDAEVVLWDAGTDNARAVARMREIKLLGVPAVAVITSPDHLAPALAAADGLRIGIDKDRLGVKAVPQLRRPRAVDSIAVKVIGG